MCVNIQNRLQKRLLRECDFYIFSLPPGIDNIWAKMKPRIPNTNFQGMHALAVGTLLSHNLPTLHFLSFSQGLDKYQISNWSERVNFGNEEKKSYHVIIILKNHRKCVVFKLRVLRELVQGKIFLRRSLYKYRCNEISSTGKRTFYMVNSFTHL